MFCYKCGANMPDTSTFCPACGTAVQQSAQPVPPPPAAGASASQQTAEPSAPQAQATRPQQPVSPWLNVPAAPVQQQTESKAVISLILGILTFPFWILTGIPAIILGHLSKATIRKSMGRLKGDGMATAGLILGYLSVVIFPIVLIIAAIAIPNLLRARQAANEAVATSTVRALNTVELTYSTQYPQAGYAKSLAVLGNGGGACSKQSAEHACLLDAAFICGPASCVKDGYSYHISAVCGDNACTDYVITAAPLTSARGARSFCSTSDAIIRYRRDAALTAPLATAEDCTAWTMI